MSCYTRENWHSGLTYQQACPDCRQVVQYTDYNLDFRPWYPDGFVYCPRCKKPLRHNENYAINRPYQPVPPTAASAPTTAPRAQAVFCSMCGKKFGENDHFCSQCGNKR